MAKTLKFCEPVVLASQSPRRKELLSQVLDDFEIIPADVDEHAVKIASPRALVRALSQQKAFAVKALPECKGKIVIGADTVVYLDKLYGKPVDFADAVRMISELNGKEHQVFTGVTVAGDKGYTTFSVRSLVTLKAMTEEEIVRYVEECQPYDKAGAYAVQQGVIVEDYKGSLSNIIGLPMEKTVEILKEVQSGSYRTIR